MSLSSNELKERAYLLLYGLLNDQEAEEFRTLIATDSEAATAFETARLNVGYFSDFVKTVPFSNPEDDLSSQNVSIDSNATAFLPFDPVADSFDEGVFAESSNLKVSSVGLDYAENDEKSSRHSKIKKRARRQKEHFSKALLKQDDISTTNARHGAFIHGFGALFKGIDGSVGRFLAVLWKSPVFVGLLALLFILWIVVTVAALRCNYLLTRRFFDDFRIQIAIPRTLARDVTQSIVMRTTGVDGRPRRVPARFCFTNSDTNEVLLNHTESGNSDGNLVCVAPDLTDFPSQTTLSVFIGSNETALFKTPLKVVDFDEYGNEERATWNAPSSPRFELEKGLNSPVFRDVWEFSTSGVFSSATTISGGQDSENVEIETTSSSFESERVFLRFYPESGRFVAGFTNNVSVFCSDKDGRPLARRVSLFQENVDKPVASFVTSDQGVASFQWSPVGDVALGVVLSSKRDNDSGGAFQNPFQQDYLPDRSLPHDILNDFPTMVEIDSLTGKGFAFFYPAVASESAYLSFSMRTFASEESLQASLASVADVPLLATVEKRGVTVWQQFLTSPKNEEIVELQLPNSLSGFMKISLYSVAQRRFLKLAETTVFRNPCSHPPVEYSVKIIKSVSDEKNRLLVINRSDSTSADVSTAAFTDERIANIEVYWAPELRSATTSLDVDEVFMEMDQERRDAAVKTASYSSSFNPPIVFDNLEPLVENARIKLESFKENEAKSFLWTVRVVFVSCCSIGLVVLFFTIFRLFSLWKSLFLCFLSICLFFFTLGIQNTLDSFIHSSQDVVFAIDEVENQPVIQSPSLSKNNAVDEDESLLRPEATETPASVRLVTTSELKQGATEIVLDDLLLPSEHSTGVILVKLNDGNSHIAKIVSLE